MDMSDFYKNIDKQRDNKFCKKSNKREATTLPESRTFNDVDSVMEHMRENKSRVFSVRDEICDKFGEEEGRKIYRFLRKIAQNAANAAGMGDGAINGILFTPGGGTFTSIGAKKPE
jgi:hypothetical protein